MGPGCGVVCAGQWIAAAPLASAILAARRAHPREVAGLLLGERHAILDIAVVANRADDDDAFDIDPLGAMRAEVAARSAGMSWTGYFHSHPSGDPRPSRRDRLLSAAVPHFHLIVSPDGAWALYRVEACEWRALQSGPCRIGGGHG